MFGTYERFNLVRAAFARNGSNTYVFEDFYTQGRLRLGNNWTGGPLYGSGPMKGTSFLFDIKMTVNGAPVKYSYFADEGSLRLTSACCEEAEIALTDRSHFRIRGKDAGLRLELRSSADENAEACRGICASLDGRGWEGEFGKYGKLYFESIAGSLSVTAIYDEKEKAYALVRIDFLPDAITGICEAAVHDYRDKLLPFGEYEDFDELVENNRADFEFFSRIYSEAAPGYEEMARYARWTVWSHRTKAIGTFQQPHILFQNTWSCAAAPWQQSYNAMSMLADPKEAWRQICVMFLYQDERTGRLPNMVTYSNPPMLGMQPAFQGFALDFLFRNVGDDFITEDDAENMYPKMASWANYWTTYRNAGFGDDVVALISPHESGWDDLTLFKDGLPTVDPNSLAFLVLMMEGVARIASKSRSYTDTYDDWMIRAKKLTDTLVNEYWDGERFVAKYRGKPVDSLSLGSYQAIMLGKRLPHHIIDKIAEKLVVEGKWLTEIGLASESMESAEARFAPSVARHYASFTSGRVIGPLNMILTVGLQAAGKQKEAELIARRFCSHLNREGIILGYAPYNYYKFDGRVADQQIPPHNSDGWPWSPWTANCFLTMATGIIGK